MQADDFLKDKCIWIAHLSTGKIVFQDDGRPGHYEPSAWKRLWKFLHLNPWVHIKRMQLKFRSHIVDLPSEKPHYFYSHGIVKGMNSTKESFFHIVGWTSEEDDSQLDVVWYKTPELVPTRNLTRPLDKCKPFTVIRRHGKTTD